MFYTLSTPQVSGKKNPRSFHPGLLILFIKGVILNFQFHIIDRPADDSALGDIF